MMKPEEYKGSAQEKNTLDFIASYLLRKEIAAEQEPESDVPETAKEDTPKLSAPREWDGNIQEGDVRLLADVDGFQYVAVLEKRDCNYLVAPYSAYSFPATDAELKLKRSGGAYLEVIQVWNARTIHYLQLKKSWLAASLTDDELDAIYTVRSHFLLNTELPETLRDCVGMPVFHAQDPRVGYQEESMKLFAEIDRKDFELLDLQAAIDEKIQALALPIQTAYAAAGTKALLSEVYDASALSVQEILENLQKGVVPGAFSGTAERGEWSTEEMIWTSAQLPKANCPVLFWLRKEGKVLGFGEMVEQTGIFLRCRMPEFEDAEFAADDIVIFAGRE